VELQNNMLSPLNALSDKGDASKGAALVGYKGKSVAEHLEDSEANNLKVSEKLKESVSLGDFSPSADGVGDNLAKFTSAINGITDSGGRLHVPIGDFYCSGSALNDDPALKDKISIKGDSKHTSKITTDTTSALMWVREGFDFSDLRLSQNNLGTGRGFSTNDAKQSKNNSLSDMTITGFRYGVFKRYSLWDSYKNLVLGGNTCGIRLARHNYQADNANPEPSGAWNYWNDGWFHNALSVDNVVVGGGEVGIWAASMCTVYNNVTCQGQETDGTANDVLPSGEKGTGIRLDGGTDGSRSGWNNLINSYYVENTKIGVHAINQEYLGINSMFMQGGNTVDKAQAAILCDNSVVEVNGLVGQDYFENLAEVKNGGIVYMNSQHGSMVGSKFTADATSKFKPRGMIDKGRHDYFLNKLAAETKAYTLPVAVSAGAIAKLYVNGLYDGYSEIVGEATIINFNTSSDTQIQWLTNAGVAPARVAVTVSKAGTVTITLSGSQTLPLYAMLDIIGGNNVSGNSIEITGV